MYKLIRYLIILLIINLIAYKLQSQEELSVKDILHNELKNIIYLKERNKKNILDSLYYLDLCDNYDQEFKTTCFLYSFTHMNFEIKKEQLINYIDLIENNNNLDIISDTANCYQSIISNINASDEVVENIKTVKNVIIKALKPHSNSKQSSNPNIISINLQSIEKEVANCNETISIKLTNFTKDYVLNHESIKKILENFKEYKQDVISLITPELINTLFILLKSNVIIEHQHITNKIIILLKNSFRVKKIDTDIAIAQFMPLLDKFLSFLIKQDESLSKKQARKYYKDFILQSPIMEHIAKLEMISITTDMLSTLKKNHSNLFIFFAQEINISKYIDKFKDKKNILRILDVKSEIGNKLLKDVIGYIWNVEILNNNKDNTDLIRRKIAWQFSHDLGLDGFAGSIIKEVANRHIKPGFIASLINDSESQVWENLIITKYGRDAAVYFSEEILYPIIYNDEKLLTESNQKKLIENFKKKIRIAQDKFDDDVLENY